MNKEEARKKIKELVDNFKINYSQHKKELEANTETKLIEPLFEILGWSKNDFVKQEQARRGTKSGHADYAFKIGDKIVFFVEVKKVGILLEKEADKQVVSYALSKRIPFAVSTNFESMNIFCVEQEKALTNKFRVFRTPEDYLQNFDDLLYLSKEYFEQGLTLKKAESEDRLKKRMSIDKPLLEDFMRIRKLIADDIHNKYKEKYELNERDWIVQRILDRLIFIRRCEDIGINPENVTIQEIRHLPDNKAYSHLKEIFKIYDEKYNSGLFAIGKDNDCDSITIDGSVIKKLAYDLYESKNGEYYYNFDWIDADILGQVYEQYLGIILSQTKSGKAKFKDGQAHRKEQGIYYTPTYIVDYIVKNTVGEMLKDKKVDAKKIKILDPACGSGSFLIKALDYMQESLSNDKDANQYKFDSQGLYSAKTEILKNNLFGVDLDNKAVEITKLNLLLKAAEKNRKLPEEVDLHIKQGNSLIDDESVVGLNAFKWKDDFEEGSFDVVIGNPPYINNRNLLENEKKFFEEKFKTAYQQYDIYVLFYELGLKLLKNGGYLAFIAPNKFAITKYGLPLRELFLNYRLVKVVDVSQLGVFSEASTYPFIVVLQKINIYNNKIIIEKPNVSDFNKREIIEIKQSELKKEEPFLFNLNKKEQLILKKINGEKIISIYRAKPTSKEIGQGNTFVISNKEIERYNILESNKKILKKKEWLIDVPAILMKKICYTPTASILKNNELIPINTVYVIHTQRNDIPLEYLLSILNSKLIGYYARKKYGTTAMQGGFIELRTFEIEDIPVKIDNNYIDILKFNAQNIINLLERLKTFKDKKNVQTAKLEEEIKKIDNEIDQLVYKLYGITEEEKKLIEGSLK